jgi:hypothetical protein
MARRPSTVSIVPLPSRSANAAASQISPITANSHAPIFSPSRSDLVFARLGVNHGDSNPEVDLDELFAKYTVSEVKAIQRQLRWVQSGGLN